MKRDALIKLILKHVPKGGNVCVQNCNIHDENIEVEEKCGSPGEGPLTMGKRAKKKYFLLSGTAGY